MALSNSFFTLRSGSTKSLTFQQFRGRQVTKDRVSVVANPQTTGQMEQRLKIPMVASARASLKGLVDHSFEGTAYGWQSLQQFSSLNLSKNALDVKGWIPKGAMDTGEANFIVSRGSLQNVVFINGPAYEDGRPSGTSIKDKTGRTLATPYFSGFNNDFMMDTASENPTQQEYEECFLNTLLGTQTTEQLSFLIQKAGREYSWTNNGTEHSTPKHDFLLYRIDNAHTLAELGLSLIVTSTDTEQPEFELSLDGNISIFGKFRLVNSGDDTKKAYKLSVSSQTYAAVGNGVTYPFCLSYSSSRGINTQNGVVSDEGYFISYFALIHSRLRDNVWSRSSQRLLPVNPNEVKYDWVAATYKKGASNSLKFLNNGDDPTYIPGNSGSADAGDTANNDGSSSSSSSSGTKSEG